MEKYSRTKSEAQASLIEETPQPKEEKLIVTPSEDQAENSMPLMVDGSGEVIAKDERFDALQKQIDEMATFNRLLLQQQVETQKKLEAYEAQKEQERQQMVTSADGRGVQIPEGMRVRTAAHRTHLIKPITPTSSDYYTRYASEKTIERRLAEGWRIHPKMGDPGSGVKQIRDLIPIEIKKDHPDLLEKRQYMQDRQNAHEREAQEKASRGRQYDQSYGVNTFTEFKQEKEFKRTNNPED